MKAVLLVLFGFLVLVACQADDHLETEGLQGTWVEKSPLRGGTSSITFLSASQVLINYWTGDGYEKHFYTFRQEQGQLVFTDQQWGAQYRSVLNEEGELEINCFYPCIPENPYPTVFVRQ